MAIAPEPLDHIELANAQCVSRHACRFLVVGLLCLGALLRFVALDQYPLPAHQDELSDIYDGYCIATTGADRAGDPWPIIIRGMGPGDYHPGLYAYLAGLSTRALGLSVWAGRLPAAIAGVLTLFLVFLVARRMLGDRLAIIALLFLVFQPAHTLYSRQAHTGGCLPPLFAVLIVYLLQRAIDALRHSGRQEAFAWVVATGFMVGFSTNAYGASRLSGLLFAIVCTGFIVCTGGVRHGAWRRTLGMVGVLTLSVALGASPQLYAAIKDPSLFFARAANVVPPLAYGPRWWLHKTMLALGANLNPQHLFWSFGEHSLLTIARLSLVSLPFLYVGIAVATIRLVLRPRAAYFLLILATAISLAPAVTSNPNPHPLRASGVWALYPIFAALGAGALGQGALWIWRRVRARAMPHESIQTPYLRVQSVGARALAVCIVASGVWNVARYLDRPELHGPDAQFHLYTLAKWMERHSSAYDRVYVDVPGLFPYLYFAVYTHMPPDEFRSVPRELTVTAHGWEHYNRFGKYFFTTRLQADEDWVKSRKDERWLLVTAEGDIVHYGIEHQPERLTLGTEKAATRSSSVPLPQQE